MMASSTNIQGQMEQVDTDLGYTWDSYTDPNSVRIGVNWGYTSSQLESKLDPELVIAIAAFLLLLLTDFSVFEIAHQVGFGDESNFSTRFTAMVGQSPQQYRKSAMKPAEN